MFVAKTGLLDDSSLQIINYGFVTCLYTHSCTECSRHFVNMTADGNEFNQLATYQVLAYKVITQKYKLIHNFN